MDLSLDDIKSIIESNKNTTRGGNSQRNEVKVGWLPEGTHKIRFFVDSERNMMRTYSSHKINVRDSCALISYVHYLQQ